ncbi:MAG: hypothetical protein WBE55_22160 [Candidatus Sulfotelmatobacter sp.]
MRVREHPKIGDWPPEPGGVDKHKAGARPQESEIVVEAVHVEAVMDKTVPLTGRFEGRSDTYDVLTLDPVFAKSLAKEFSKHIGWTLKQFGDIDVGF